MQRLLFILLIIHVFITSDQLYADETEILVGICSEKGIPLTENFETPDVVVGKGPLTRVERAKGPITRGGGSSSSDMPVVDRRGAVSYRLGELTLRSGAASTGSSVGPKKKGATSGGSSTAGNDPIDIVNENGERIGGATSGHDWCSQASSCQSDADCGDGEVCYQEPDEESDTGFTCSCIPENSPPKDPPEGVQEFQPAYGLGTEYIPSDFENSDSSSRQRGRSSYSATIPPATGSGLGYGGGLRDQMQAYPKYSGGDPKWYFSDGFPWISWKEQLSAKGRELVGYRPDGSQLIFRRTSPGNYVFYIYRDSYDNDVEYIYDNSDEEIIAVRQQNIEKRYTRDEESLLIETYVFDDNDYKNGTHLSQFDEEVIFSTEGLVQEYRYYESDFVPKPTGAAKLMPLEMETKNRVVAKFEYHPVHKNLTKMYIERPSGEQETLFQIDWKLEDNLWKVYKSYDANGNSRTFDYIDQGTSVLVTVTEEDARHEYTIDSQDRVIQYKVVSLNNPRQLGGDEPAEMPFRKWTYQYDPTCNCSALVTRVDTPDGSYWEGEYDPFSGFLLAERKPSPSGAGEAEIQYEYENVFRGGALSKVIDQVGFEYNFDYEWRARKDYFDPAVKPKTLQFEVDDVDLVNGSKQTLNSKAYFFPDGRVDRFRRYDGSIIQSKYYNDLRKLLKETVVGPNNGSDKVDPSSDLTRTVSYGRKLPEGFVTSVSEGVGAFAKTTNYTIDEIGRVREVLIDSGTGATQRQKLYYDWLGYPTTTLAWNKDADGLAPKDTLGNATGREWVRSDIIRGPGGLIKSEYNDLNAPFAPDNSIDQTDGFWFTKYSYDSSNRPKLAQTPLNTVKYVYDGYGDLYSVSDVGSDPLLKLYKLPTQIIYRHAVRESTSTGNLEYADTVYDLASNNSGVITDITYPNGVSQKLKFDKKSYPISWELYQSGSLQLKKHNQLDQLNRLMSWTVEEVLTGELSELGSVLYDNAGRTHQVSDQHRVVSTYEYYPTNLIKSITDLENKIDFEYYAGTELVSRTHHNADLGQDYWVDYDYDSQHRLKSVSHLGKSGTSQPLSSSYYYDSLSNLTRVQLPDGIVREQSVGADGFLWWEKPNISETLILQNIRVFDYDSKNVVLQGIDGTGRITNSLFDKYGIRELQHPGSGLETFSYDKTFKLKQYVDASGTQVTPTYDSLGRTSSAEWLPTNGLTFTRELSRDSFDRAYKLTDFYQGSSVSTEYSFDKFWKIASEKVSVSGYPDRTTTLGRLNQNLQYDFNKYHDITTDGITWRYLYDQEQHVDSIQLENAPSSLPTTVASFGYNGNTNNFISLANNINADVIYDSYGRLKAVDYEHQGVSIDTWQVDRNPIGLITSVQKTDAEGYGSAFKYDELRRPSAKTGVESVNQFLLPYEQILAEIETSLEFENSSQLRVKKIKDDGFNLNEESYQIDTTKGRYLGFDFESLSYDSNGNISSDDAKNLQYEFDPLGRLISINDSQGASLREYRYDSSGRLIIDSRSNSTIQNHWVGWHNFQRYKDGALSDIYAQYPFRMDELLASWSYKDGLWEGSYFTHGPSSPSKAFDASGNLLESYTFDFDGVPTFYDASEIGTQDGSLIGNEFLFKGMQWDSETGLYYVRNRFYDPEKGIFISPDPLSDKANLGSRYTFAANDPVNKSDPMGTQSIMEDVYNWVANYLGADGKIDPSPTGYYKSKGLSDEQVLEQLKSPAGELNYLRGVSDYVFDETMTEAAPLLAAAQVGVLTAPFDPSYDAGKRSYFAFNRGDNLMGSVYAAESGLYLMLLFMGEAPSTSAGRSCGLTAISEAPCKNFIVRVPFRGPGALAPRVSPLSLNGQQIMTRLGGVPKIPNLGRGINQPAIEAIDDVLFHYTTGGATAVENMSLSGIGQGASPVVFTTPRNLTPIQAHIELGLPGNRGLPMHRLRIDASKLGCKVLFPEPGVVGPVAPVNGIYPRFRAPQWADTPVISLQRAESVIGGGTEYVFPHKINPEFLQGAEYFNASKGEWLPLLIGGK
ncbi:MAG: RHS repeat-associated core domain-containing protein [Deltaproteobacteria bacterium]|nr:RHS repeat-associated core domain-containing protein [Deltaproteobacteria bacterium]